MLLLCFLWVSFSGLDSGKRRAREDAGQPAKFDNAGNDFVRRLLDKYLFTGDQRNMCVRERLDNLDEIGIQDKFAVVKAGDCNHNVVSKIYCTTSSQVISQWSFPKEGYGAG